MSDRYILLAEDNPGDVFLIRESLRDLDVRLEIAQSGDQAIELIESLDSDPTRSVPTLALLDLNLPARHGLDVLQRLRRSPQLVDLPVVVVSSSDYQADRDKAAALGINAYFRKPSDLDEFFLLADVVRPLLPIA